MSPELTCPKCSGRMKEGELKVFTAISQIDETRVSQGMIGVTGGSLSPFSSPFQTTDIDVEGPLWREESDKEEGLIIKRNVKKNLPIQGMRCLECGYIELFVKVRPP